MSSSPERPSPRHRLAVAAIFKNEARFLEEWIEYHRVVGVEHFWLYNDASTDDGLEILAPYVEAGVVEVQHWPSANPVNLAQAQVSAYRDALGRAVGETAWLALIDLDEYLLPRQDATVAECLDRHFRDVSAVYVNWLNFGTGGRYLRRRGPILNHLTACSDGQHQWDGWGKTIVRPETVLIPKAWYAHHLILREGAGYCDGDGGRIPTSTVEPQLDGRHHGSLLRINHYTFRDESHFRSVRLPRFVARRMDEADIWHRHAAFSRCQDDELVNFLRDRHQAAYAARWGRPEEDWPLVGPLLSAQFRGRLGNNLFQVAATSALAWDHHAEPVFPDLIDAHPYKRPLFRCSTGPEPDAWTDWEEPTYAFSPIPFGPDTRLLGFFQSEKYFAHHRERLLHLFSPSPAAQAYIHDKYGELLERPDTVAVPIRYWQEEDPAGTKYPQFGTRYLEMAAEFLPAESTFVISSNNLFYAAANLPAGIARRTFILNGEPPFIDLFVLAQCRHSIITNSSFGWWAAWLNQNPDQVVVRPERWVNGLPYDDVCPADWIVVDAPVEPGVTSPSAAGHPPSGGPETGRRGPRSPLH